jgi:hypothetical protein
VFYVAWSINHSTVKLKEIIKWIVKWKGRAITYGLSLWRNWLNLKLRIRRHGSPLARQVGWYQRAPNFILYFSDSMRTPHTPNPRLSLESGSLRQEILCWTEKKAFFLMCYLDLGVYLNKLPLFHEFHS